MCFSIRFGSNLVHTLHVHILVVVLEQRAVESFSDNFILQILSLFFYSILPWPLFIIFLWAICYRSISDLLSLIVCGLYTPSYVEVADE